MENNVKRVSRMYTVYQMRNSMVGPEDEAALKEFILEHSAARLARIGIDPTKLDQIFSSERDGEKLIVRYGTKLEGSNASIPVVFEAAGQNGTRLVGFSNAYTIAVSDNAEYDRLMSGEEDNKVVDDNPAYDWFSISGDIGVRLAWQPYLRRSSFKKNGKRK